MGYEMHVNRRPPSPPVSLNETAFHG